MLRIATSMLLVALMISVAAPVTAQDRGLGLITQNNVAAMVVDLNPSYANVKIEGSDGSVADAAVTRYRTGRVKALMPLSGTGELGQQRGGAPAGAGQPAPGGPR